MNRPQPDRERHERFCTVEEWERVRDARGRTGTHHITYELPLHDGRVLRTRISHPVDRTVYGAALWSHILRDQLTVTEDEFWSCVLDGKLPDRGTPSTPKESLPAELVYLLIHRVGLPEETVSQLTKEDAVARLQRYWTNGV
ncbi:MULTISPECIES: cytotoxic translational repressor of toxin-antitoxin stability system [unclassified Streptomyces]|uniref:cytotoxic translational repressor of toxin-antitoxin stability system n=1 Tax=unclassified Streptomyces TaxID=2593676 RepID=UPI000DD73D27|nr:MULTISPECIES: cytotoxic translational repressor of toxin-antitoxin stability system [unclassified Streptomyces]QZZ28624.1 cytotoxic translational repressor of toxin-antitoxin stability system [Streptomyces sp. ST1015]